METASATLSYWEQGKCVQVSLAVGANSPEVYLCQPLPLTEAVSLRSLIEKAMGDALAQGAGYPFREAEELSRPLLDAKLESIVHSNPPKGALSLVMGAAPALALVPELIPVNIDGRQSWLDAEVAVHRTMGQIACPLVNRPAPRTIAVLYTSGGNGMFERLARGFCASVGALDGVTVDLFAGSGLVDLSCRHEQLRKIFREHRAVLFLGHAHVPQAQRGGGWQLTDREHLSMKDLDGFLKKATVAPEVVFANCCSGAWQDPDGEPYPQIFLRNGVRFFIGTWMDIVIRSAGAGQQQDLREIQELVTEFFQRWVGAPDRAIDHLFAAKKRARPQPHPLTSLFQIYTSASDPAVASQEPRGAIVGGLKPGQQLGSFCIESTLWRDPYGQCFWATADGRPALIQVLADEWQDRPGLEDELRREVERLTAAQLGEGHLVPSRYAALARPEQSQKTLHALIYERPHGESADTWRTLKSWRERLEQAEGRCEAISRMGSGLAQALAELHAKGLVHANLDPERVLVQRSADGERVVLRDAWLARIQPGQLGALAYAAPEDADDPEGLSPARDCWALGVMLYELLTSSLPEQLGEQSGSVISSALTAVHTPARLSQAVRDCLVPWSRWRASAQTIADQLSPHDPEQSWERGPFADQIATLMGAGHRLLYIVADEGEPVEQMLSQIARTQGSAFYVAEEAAGLFDRTNDSVVCPWLDARALGEGPGLPAPALVTAVNVMRIFEAVAAFNGSAPSPIVVIRRSHWWTEGTTESFLYACRVLRNIQFAGRGPTVIVVDAFLHLQSDLTGLFAIVGAPQLTGREMLEQIEDFANQGGLGTPSAEEARVVATGLYPCSRRDLMGTLRMSALRYGQIDGRAIGEADGAREQLFRGLGLATYLPINQLPLPGHIGLPTGPEDLDDAWWEGTSEGRIEQWLARLRDAEVRRDVPAPRRVLITGPSGHGKTLLAGTLARRLGRPLVAIDAAFVATQATSESGPRLEEALSAASMLQSVCVLIEGVDSFTAGSGQRTSNDSFLRRWVEAGPGGLTIFMTATARAKLSPGWRRLAEIHFDLATPPTVAEDGDAAVRARQAVLTAVFTRLNRSELARRSSLMAALAAKNRLPNPLALYTSNAALSRDVEIRSPRDLEQWVVQTLTLAVAHGNAASVAQPEFWSLAAAGKTAS
jgi:hypothetical protein